MKTISIYRRTGVNSDCGAVRAVGRVSAILARGSVTAIGSTPVLALELALCSAPTACGDGRTPGAFHTRKNANAQLNRDSRQARRQRLEICSLRAMLGETGLFIKIDFFIF